MLNSSKNIHTTDIIQTEQFAFMYLGIHMYIHTHAYYVFMY